MSPPPQPPRAFLHDCFCLQADAVQEVSEYVAQLRRVGKGLGVFQFDQFLGEQVANAAAA